MSWRIARTFAVMAAHGPVKRRFTPFGLSNCRVAVRHARLRQSPALLVHGVRQLSEGIGTRRVSTLLCLEELRDALDRGVPGDGDQQDDEGQAERAATDAGGHPTA